MPNYIGQALQNLGNTLQTGMTQYGQGELQRAKLEYEMNDPVEREKRAKAIQKIKWGKKAFAVSDFGMKPTNDPEEAAWKIKQVGVAQDALSRIFDDKISINPDTMTFMRSDGSPLTNNEIEPHMGVVANMVGINTSRRRYLRKQAEREAESNAQTGEGSIKAQQRWEKFQKNEGTELEDELRVKMEQYASIPAQFREDETFNKMALAGIEETRNDIKRYDAKIEKAAGKDTDFRFAYENRKDKSLTPGEFKQIVWDKQEGEKALELKINKIHGSFKGAISKDTAIQIATGVIKVVQSPDTGDWILVNTGTGKTVPITSQGSVTAEATPKEPITEIKTTGSLWEAAEKGTGFYSAMLDYGSKASGILRGPIAKQTIKARQKLTMAQKGLFRALRDSSKVLAFEMKTIIEEHPIGPDMWRSPEIARANFEVIDEALRIRIREQSEIANDMVFHVAERKKAKVLVKAMEDFLKVLGVPIDTTPTVSNEDEYKAIKKGQQYKDPQGNVRIKK